MASPSTNRPSSRPPPGPTSPLCTTVRCSPPSASAPPCRCRRNSILAGWPRSDRSTDLVIDSLISLRPGQSHLDVQTTVHNTADDHRMRVLLPSGTKALTYQADTPFDVVTRPVALRADNHTYRELEVETKPQQTWTAVHDARRGLAVVADGSLLETAVRDLPGRPIALTLFRGTRRTVFTNGEPEGQQRGPLTFRYALVPLAGAPDPVQLGRLGQHLAAGLRTVQLRAADIAIHRQSRAVPTEAGLLRVDGPALVSSLRAVGPELELRLFNPAARRIRVRVTAGSAGFRLRRAAHIDFEGNLLAKLRCDRTGLPLVLQPKQILTVRLG
ncbi:MAG: glycoside hydrolase family 38 C-terminal domain-containing protein [Opitutales bacterium]